MVYVAVSNNVSKHCLFLCQICHNNLFSRVVYRTQQNDPSTILLRMKINCLSTPLLCQFEIFRVSLLDNQFCKESVNHCRTIVTQHCTSLLHKMFIKINTYFLFVTLLYQTLSTNKFRGYKIFQIFSYIYIVIRICYNKILIK